MPDDRDHLANKRMETSGMLLGGLFRQLFIGLVQDMKKTIKRRLDHQFPLAEIFKHKFEYYYERIKVQFGHR